MADLASSIMNMTGNLAKGEFFDLVKNIGECRSKQEEDRIILDEISALKQKMGAHQPTFTKKMKEYLVRLIYCEMLGHDASFGYIKAVELSASSNLLQKRVGYLTASLCLSPDHEFRFMLVNQFTRDMASINYLEVCAALNAVCRLATVDTIPALLPEVTNKLRHEQEAVRKKAVMAVQKFYSLQPRSIAHLDDRIRRALCDKDPSVMAAVLCLLLDLIKDNPAPYRDLVPSFVSILKQIVDHRLPRDYDYHRVPAPWVQIHLLRILARLGHSDQRTSEGMYEVLVDVMRRADTGINVGYAIVYECVRTVTAIYPNTVLLDAAASSIARFIGSDNHNLKYLGVKGLAAIVKDHPRYAAQHQLAVIDCLEDPDETLKRKTLDLLHRMTNPVNVDFITAKLLEYLEKSTDVFLRTDLVQRISQSAERYAPSTSWYIQTMTRVFLLAGELVKPEAAHTLMQLIAEGTGDDEEADMQLRKDAVDNYVALLQDEAASSPAGAALPDILVQTMCWTLGEYGYLSEDLPLADLVTKLAADIAHRPFHDPCTQGFVVASVVKMVAQTGVCPAEVSSLLALYGESLNLDLQQRCLEFATLLQSPAVMVAVLPVDASCEDLGVDESLSFLDTYVEAAVARGAPRYIPPADHAEDLGVSEEKEAKEPGLKLTPYAKPEKPSAAPASTLPGGPATAGGGGGNLLAGLSLNSAAPSGVGGAPVPGGGGLAGSRPGLRPVAQVWSRQGAAVGARGPAPPSSSSMPAAPAPVAPLSSSAVDSQGHGLRREEPPAAPTAPRELTEKEKMAQALFGGLGTPASKPAWGVGATGKGGAKGAKSTVADGGKPKPPSSSGAVDLLDLDDNGTNVSQAPPRVPPATTTASSPPASGVPSSSLLDFSDEPPSKPAPPPPVAAVAQSDPFAALSAPPMQAAPLPGLLAESCFAYQGRQLQPLAINTQDFGGRWTQMRFQAPAPVPQTSVRSLGGLAAALQQKAGLYVVDSIPRTAEVIAAGQVGPNGEAVLVHTKLHSQRGAADCLIKCNDNALAQQLGQHLTKALGR